MREKKSILFETVDFAISALCKISFPKFYIQVFNECVVGTRVCEAIKQSSALCKPRVSSDQIVQLSLARMNAL